MTTEPKDDGFTLLELLLSISILTVIMASITTALVVFLRNGNEALGRDDYSGGVTLLGSYLDRDIASADSASQTSAGGAGCAISGSTSNLLELTWSEYSATSTNPSPAPSTQPYRAVYRLEADPDGSSMLQLRRWACLGSSQLDTSVLLHAIPAASAVNIGLPADASCVSGKALTLDIASYGSDTTSPYTFKSCLKTRISP